MFDPETMQRILKIYGVIMGFLVLSVMTICVICGITIGKFFFG